MGGSLIDRHLGVGSGFLVPTGEGCRGKAEPGAVCLCGNPGLPDLKDSYLSKNLKMFPGPCPPQKNQWSVDLVHPETRYGVPDEPGAGRLAPALSA